MNAFQMRHYRLAHPFLLLGNPWYNQNMPWVIETARRPATSPFFSSGKGKSMRVKIVLGAFLLFCAVAAARAQTTPAYQSGSMQVSQNLNTSASGSVSIFIGSYAYPGKFSLRIYNSAGEVIRTLEDTNLTGPLAKTYLWDGTNVHGDRVASGVYIIRGQDAFEVFNSRIAVHH
jgi:hypothetical protein